ncbi:hypothetical protein PPACK8108_LOCUS12686 [Phakopsora pachyrhizi]|uniref:Uncharacterized protein n=1 Tax=Phakopsora pachyrhizi TaxID=170000 RepID=A0AAV0B3D8_PHAPC|nr:hypothetical protein PPACK8108_LOCUS12686 [Phakopsora pachyrhizi]
MRLRFIAGSRSPEASLYVVSRFSLGVERRLNGKDDLTKCREGVNRKDDLKKHREEGNRKDDLTKRREGGNRKDDLTKLRGRGGLGRMT